jgi:F0F1-type ATP synthase beta subunit
MKIVVNILAAKELDVEDFEVIKDEKDISALLANAITVFERLMKKEGADEVKVSVTLQENIEDKVTISKQEYERLVDRDEWLNCLEAAGVDNWDGYGIAHDIKDGVDI